MQYQKRAYGRTLTVILIIVTFCIFIPLHAIAVEKKSFVVVIDAGHGGTDHGAIENGVNEKDVNLAVALKLGELIKKKLKNTRVIFTRSTDEFISLQKRADIANNAKADLFISIHCNSVDKSNKNRSNVLGATTYVLGRHKDANNLAVAQRENSVVELDANDSAHFSQYDPSQDESYIIFEMTQKKNLQNSVRFASAVQKEMASAGRYSRGVQQAGFWVLWSTAMPSALVELDFICNPDQAKFLNSSAGQDKLAGAIFNAVKSYESYFRQSLGDFSNLSDQYNMDETESFSQNVVSGVSETVELPVQTSSSGKKVHRQEIKKNTNQDNTHRRRSSAGRTKGSSNVEEAIIAVVQEKESGKSINISSSVASTTSENSKTVKKNDKNTRHTQGRDNKTSKPARRSKEHQSNRKAVKQNVNVVYKIFLFSSDQELKANDECFKGLTPIALFRENNLFNYTYGESTDRKEMEILLEGIEELFPDARIIKRYL